MKKSNHVMVTGLLIATLSLLSLNISLAQQSGHPQKYCPILGGEIDKSEYIDYDGKRIYFCCRGCKTSFNKDPEKYIKMMESKGIVFDKVPGYKEGSKQKHEESHSMGSHHNEGGHMHEGSMH